MNRSSSLLGGLNPDEPLAIAVGSFSFLALGFLLDIATTQELVVAILYNAPIAFSGLSTTHRLTFYAVLAALAANLIAGYLNASALGGVDTIALLNRFIAALSFLLVGFMTGALRRTSARLAALKLSEKQATREHKLHRLTSALEGALHPTELLDASCHALRDLLEAEAVIISNFAHNHFTPPQYSDPVGAPLSFARVGQGVPWLVAASMTNDPPVVAGIVDGRPLMVGRLNPSEGPDLVVLIVQARAEDATPFLGEALRSLTSLLERAVLLENLDQQRDELKRRNGVIRDLVYAFSHDLRTPLMANAMNMRLALEGAFGELSPDFKHTLKNGLSANEDLLELADSLLLVARHESGEELGSPNPVDLGALLRQAHERLGPLLDEKQVRVDLSAPQDLKVLGRPAELRRVFQNLLDNAIKFSPQEGVVEVRLFLDDTSTSAQGARLEVLDRGPGVPSALRPRLFGRFSHGRAGGGSGLGLYLARQIVTEHGGEILYSSREGGGSRFTVFLPIAREAVTS